MTQPLPWEKNAAVPVPPAPEPVPLDAYTAPAAPEPELVPLDIYDAPAPAPKPIKPLVDIDSLNPAQREAVLSTEGPLLVLAGAGSGKTRVLTFRIAHMLGDLGVKPWQVLAITFTNKAAAEMRERLAALIPSGTRGMWVCTFHAMCVRMLREDADLLGYTGQFTIYDDDDSKRMVRDIMQALGIEQKQFPINMIRSKISSAKNAMIGPEDMLKSADSPNDKKAAQVYLELERRLRAANAMDFDDLLVRTLELLRTRPEVLDKYQERFRYISVDEYQDTNHVQYEIANLLAAKYQNLMVVGDDDQSIYSWRGAGDDRAGNGAAFSAGGGRLSAGPSRRIRGGASPALRRSGAGGGAFGRQCRRPAPPFPVDCPFEPARLPHDDRLRRPARAGRSRAARFDPQVQGEAGAGAAVEAGAVDDEPFVSGCG